MIPIKSEREIDKMREACATAAKVLDKLSMLVRPGVTTGDIDEAAADFMSDEQSRSAFLGYRNFPGNICISVNEEVVHGIGGTRRIQYGDIVKLDVGVIKGGWVGDTAKTVPVGAIKPAWARLLAVTEDILDRVIPIAEAGRRVGDISACSRMVITSCANLSGTASGGICTKSRRFRTSVAPEPGRA